MIDLNCSIVFVFTREHLTVTGLRCSCNHALIFPPLPCSRCALPANSVSIKLKHTQLGGEGKVSV